MKLTDLRALAAAALPGPWSANGTSNVFSETDRSSVADTHNLEDAAYIAALDPATVIALLDCIDAADALRGEGYEPRPGVAKVERYDAARAALDRLTEKT